MRTRYSEDEPSICFNASPHYPDRLDVGQIGGLPENLWDQLSAGTLNLVFAGDMYTAAKVEHLYFESRNKEKIHGARTLSLGFPATVNTEDGVLRVTPLFFWPLILEPSLNQVNTWVIRQDTAREVMINPIYWESLAGKLPTEPDAFRHLPGASGQAATMDRIARYLATALDLEWPEHLSSPIPLPALESLIELSQEPTIQSFGVVGLFQPSEENWRELPTDIERAFDQAPLPASETRHPFGLQTLTPEQATVLETALRQKWTLVKGEPRTGKNHLLLHLATNALSNGERVLIVSDRFGPLVKSQQALEQAGLGPYQFFIRQPSTDRAVLVEIAKGIQEKAALPLPEFDQAGFQLGITRALRHKNRLDQAYRSTRQRVFGDFSWTETTGLFLKSHALEGRELLNNQLSPQDFAFTFPELDQIRQVIARSHPLFHRVNTLKHPLTSLHPAVFLEKSREDSLEFVRKKIRHFSAKADDLHHRMLTLTDTYTLKLVDFYEQYYLKLSSRLKRLRESLSDNSQRFGGSFSRKTGSGLRLKALVSKQSRELLDARDLLVEEYRALKRQYESQKLLDLPFLSGQDSRQPEKLKANLDKLELELVTWRKEIAETIQEEIGRLNKNTALSDLKLDEAIAKVEDELEALLGEINESGLYDESLKHEMLTLPKKQRFLESIQEKLQTTQLNLRDYDTVYDWQRHWLKCTEQEQRVLRAIIKVKPQNWMAAFESWYLHQVLAAAFSDELPADDPDLPGFLRTIQPIKDKLPAQIGHRILFGQQQALKNLRRDKQAAWNLLFGKNARTEARSTDPGDWFRKALPGLTELLPLWFMTEDSASDCLQENAPAFDWILVVESDKIKPSNLTFAAMQAKHIVVFSDEIVPGTERLADFLTDGGIQPLHLSQRFFRAEGGAIPAWLPPDAEYQVVEAGGRFDSATATNEVEAEEVIRLLNQIQEKPQRTYPAVGILASTPEQRNRIANMLLQIKQLNKTGSEKIRQLERNGLGVFCFEEAFGVQFDIAIISTAYGPTNVQEDLPRHMPLIEGEIGQKSFVILQQIARRQIIWIHSFSGKHLDSFLQQGDPGLDLLAKTLFFAEASQQNDPLEKDLWGRKLFPVPSPEHQLSLFSEQVAHFLGDYFEEDKLQLYRAWKDHPLALVYHSGKADTHPVFLQPDPFFAQTPYTSYAWEYDQVNSFREMSLEILPAYSAKWWKQPALEARKVASLLMKSEVVPD